MKRALQILAAIALSLGALSAHAQQREFSQGELDAVLAPIALYPDPLVTHILNASVYPQDVAAAAAWSRANPQLQGDAALAAVVGALWHPSVKALVAYPDVLARMADSPQWLADLGEAYQGSPDAVNAEIQLLRQRAQATGNLQSNAQQYVYQQGDDIVVQPVYPGVVYAPYYNPYVVYGPWWVPAFRPVYWRPWICNPIIVTRVIAPVRIVAPVRVIAPGRFVRPVPVRVSQPVQVTPFHRIPESQRQPIIHGNTQPSNTRWSWQRAPITRSAPAWTPRVAPPRATPMPAPQVRFNEPRFNRGYSAAGGSVGHIRSGGNAGNRGGNGGRHRG